jgi:hypothetical protein
LPRTKSGQRSVAVFGVGRADIGSMREVMRLGLEMGWLGIRKELRRSVR